MATDLHNTLADQIPQISSEESGYYPSSDPIDSAVRVRNCGSASVHSLSPAASNEIAKAIQVLLTTQNKGYRVLAFIGAQLGNESRFLCMQVAEMLTTTYKFKVCVLDAENDGETPIELGWDVEKTPQKSGPIAKAAVSQITTELWLLNRQKTRTSILEVAPDTLRLRIEEFRSTFDYILICAPMLDQNHGAAIASNVDGVLIVVEAGRVRKQTLGQLKRTLDYANSRLIGTVMTKRVFPVPKWIARLFRL